MNTVGHRLRLTIAGESHGPLLVAIVDGCPAGLPLNEGVFEPFMARRRGGGAYTTPRCEEDRVELLSGVRNGFTTGAPIAIGIRNRNARSGEYSLSEEWARPGRAEHIAWQLYGGFAEGRGGGVASGRLTALIVAAGVIARRLLPSVAIHAGVIRLGGCDSVQEWPRLLAAARKEGDSVGAVVGCRTSPLPVGWGSPFFGSLEGELARILYAVPGIRGVEVGDGFASADCRGSAHNDSFGADGRLLTNHSGGVLGGWSSGEALALRVAVRPTPTLARGQGMLHMPSGRVQTRTWGGRHDTCFALRLPVVIESCVALTLADAFLSANHRILSTHG